MLKELSLLSSEVCPLERNSSHYLGRIQKGETLSDYFPKLLAEIDKSRLGFFWLIFCLVSLALLRMQLLKRELVRLCLHDTLVFLKDSITIVLSLESNPRLLYFLSFYLRLYHCCVSAFWGRLPFI